MQRCPWHLIGMMVLVALLTACGAGGGGAQSIQPTATPPAVGWNGEVDGAPYIAYERVTTKRLERARLVEEGELRLSQQVRRVPAYRLRDNESSAIRYTADGRDGWLAWQPFAVIRARREFARDQSTDAGRVTTLSVTRVTWPSTCLGVGGSSTTCTDEATPGFRIQLRFGEARATYHTDLRDRIVRAPG